MIDRKLDEILQEQFVYDAPSKLKYNQLSEELKFHEINTKTQKINTI